MPACPHAVSQRRRGSRRRQIGWPQISAWYARPASPSAPTAAAASRLLSPVHYMITPPYKHAGVEGVGRGGGARKGGKGPDGMAGKRPAPGRRAQKRGCSHPTHARNGHWASAIRACCACNVCGSLFVRCELVCSVRLLGEGGGAPMDGTVRTCMCKMQNLRSDRTRACAHTRASQHTRTRMHACTCTSAVHVLVYLHMHVQGIARQES